MKLAHIVEKLGLTVLTPELRSRESEEIRRGHASDLLSDVLANAPEGGVLVTLQVHMNVVAVAVHAGLVAIVFSAGRIPDNNVRKKAQEEGIALYVSRDSTFDTAGKLYQFGIRGDRP